MKPRFTDQSKNPATDQKFRVSDEHLVAENKEDVAKINHGDELEPSTKQDRGSKRPDSDKNGHKPRR